MLKRESKTLQFAFEAGALRFQSLVAITNLNLRIDQIVERALKLLKNGV